MQRVDGGHREVALLAAGPVAQVPGAVAGAGVPDALFGVHEVVAAVSVLVEANVVKDEVLELRAPVAGLSHSRRLDVLLGLAGDVARVARIGALRYRVSHVADHAQRRYLQHRVHEGRGRVGHQHHVALVDLLKPAYGRTIEPNPLLEDLLGELGDRDREVLKRTGKVGELQVDELDVLVPGKLDHLRRRELCGHASRDSFA